MPHAVLTGDIDMDEVFRRLKPVFVKTDRGILKATDAYMDRAKRTIIVDSLAIEVTPDHPREFIYTDKGAAHLAGEAVGPDTRSYHGFYVAMHELLDGWTLRLEDGTEVGPATAVSARVLPDRLAISAAVTKSSGSTRSTRRPTLSTSAMAESTASRKEPASRSQSKYGAPLHIPTNESSCNVP